MDLQNRKLTEDLAESCEGRLTEKECQQAIIEFAKNKAPGSDGLNMEFYKFFLDGNKGFTCALFE